MPVLRTRDTSSRPLEVTTDAPEVPTLAIVSPTPRAFTFPPDNHLDDSPYSTPSSSPFEPELSPSQRTSSPASFPSASTSATPGPAPASLPPFGAVPLPSPSRAHQVHRRQVSDSSVDRRPKKGDEDYIKRPENAFILFRRKCVEERTQRDSNGAPLPKKQRQADLSKTISAQWKALSSDERQYWEALAREKKREHEQQYPGYVYRPQRVPKRKTLERRRAAAAAAQAQQTGKHSGDDDDYVPPAATGSVRRSESSDAALPTRYSFVVPMRTHGRSVSAPTPPPYQSITVPRVYARTPDANADAPSLLPLLQGRPGFDYVPPSFGQAATQFGRPPQGFEPQLPQPPHQHQWPQATTYQEPTYTSMPQEYAPPTQEYHHNGWGQDAPMLSPASSTGPATPTSQHHVSDFAEDKRRADLDSRLEQQLTAQVQQQQYAGQTYEPYPFTNPFAPENQQPQQQGFDLASVPPNEQAPFAQQPADQFSSSPAYSAEQPFNGGENFNTADASSFNSCDNGQFSNAYPLHDSALFANDGSSFPAEGPGYNWWPPSSDVFAPDDFDISAIPGVQLDVSRFDDGQPAFGGEAAQFGDAGFGGGEFGVAGSKAAFASEWGQQDMGFGQGQEQYQAEWATEQQYHGQEYTTSPVAANAPTAGV
ncbi:hypothetical protein K525DRAFT_273774 [Schizophyllum commune Loenen D]|nr:hypothetical protein K525DRAFT_273774 [Schizophyllum commune Loenen D]